MTSFEPSAEHAAIRDGVAQVCAEFPGAYWRDLDARRAYPDAFVKALSRAGYLSAMIPEEYGGSGLNLSAAAAILEEIHHNGCNAAACHAQMYTMGTVLRHGNAEQKRQYLPRIADGSLRLQAFGVTEPTSGTDTLALRTTATRDGDSYVVNGQKIWTSRAEYSDLMLLLARTSPRDKVEKRTDGLSVFLIDLRALVGHGVTIKPIRTMMNHATTEVFFDNARIPAVLADRPGGQWLSLHSLRHERRAHSDCRRMRRRRKMVSRQGRGLCQGSGRFRSPDRRQSRCAISARARLCAYDRRRSDRLSRRGDVRRRARSRHRSQRAKMLAADASWEAGEACLQTHGGFGFAEEYDIERKFRETRLYQVAPISTNLILCFLAERALGLPKSYA